MFKSSFSVLLVNILGMALNLLMTVLLAQLMSVEEFGTYTTFFTMASLLSILIMTGLPSIVLRETAYALQENNTPRIYDLLVFSLAAICIMTLIAVLLLYPSLRLWSIELPVTVSVLAFVVALAIGIAFAEVISGFLQGMDRVSLGRLVAVLRPLFLVLFLAASAYAYGLSPLPDKYDYGDALWQHAAASILASMVLGYFLLMFFPKGQWQPWFGRDWWVWSKAILPIFLERLAIALHTALPVLMLASLAAMNETGLFRVAERTAFFASFGLTAVGMAARPRIARHFKNEQVQELRKLLTDSAWIILVSTLPIVALMVVFSSSILALLFGPNYTAGASILIVLAVAQGLNAATGLTSVTLIMTKNAWIASACQWVGIAVAFCTGLWLIPTLGGYGAAIASSTGLVTANVGMLVYLVRVLRLSTTVIPCAPRSAA
jgi:O-antigen/teichoic acid export membrane protein